MFTVLAAFVAYTSTALGFDLAYLDYIEESVINFIVFVLKLGGALAVGCTRLIKGNR